MERRILFFTCAAHALTHLHMGVYAAVLRLVESTFPGSANPATVGMILFGLGSLPASWLGERHGEKQLLAAFFFLSALGGLLVGLATAPWVLWLGMIVLGLGASIFHPVGNTLIAKGIRVPGRAMGQNGFWGSLGEAAAPLLAAAAAALFSSWRAAYLLLPLPTLALGIALCLVPLELAPSAESPEKLPELRGRPVTVLFWLLAAILCGGLQFTVVKTVLPGYVGAQTAHLELPGWLRNQDLRGGAFTSLMYLIGGFGQTAAGKLVHRRDGRGLYVLIYILSIPLILVAASIRGWPLIGLGVILVYVLFAVQPVENVLLARYSSPRWKALVYGLKFTLGFGVGGLGVKVSAMVAGSKGQGAALGTAAAFTGLALGCALLAWASGRRPGAPGRTRPDSLGAGTTRGQEAPGDRSPSASGS